MIDAVGPLAMLLVGYLIGSFPSGPMIARLRPEVDLSRSGSGRTGATNVLRTLGWKFALAVAVLDLFKGLLPVLIARELYLPPLAEVAAGMGAITGHNWSVFIGFKGGRGVLTSCGVFLAIAPLAVIFGVFVCVLVVFISKYVSLGSLIGAASVFVVIIGSAVTGTRHPAEWYVLAVATLVLVIVRHRDNIDRLRSGTERKFGGGSGQVPPVRPIAS